MPWPAPPTPVVSAVGHERDVTLCDLVADLRVSTPTAAAAAVVPSLEALETRLGDASAAIARGLERARGGGPGRRSGAASGSPGARAAGPRGRSGRDRVERLAPRLGRRPAARGGAGAGAAGRARSDALRRAVSARRDEAGGRVERASSLLALLSPERTVARGYAIVRDAAQRRA